MSERLRQVQDGFSWGTLRLPGERALREEIEKDPRVLQIVVEATDVEAMQPGLGASGGLRCDEFIAPALHEGAERTRQILGIRPAIQVELIPNPGWRTGVLHADAEVIRLFLSHVVVEHSHPRDVLFQLGRLVGGVLLGHVRMAHDPARMSLQTDRATLMARGLYRFQEMSADRIGLLCCQDLKSAVRVMLRSSTLLPGECFGDLWETWIESRSADESAMISPRVDEYMQLRMVSLREFMKKPRYAESFSGQMLDLPTGKAEVAEVKPITIVEPSPPAGEGMREQGSAMRGPIYRPLDGNPTIFEEIFEWTKAEIPVSSEATPVPLDPAMARRSFLLPAALWIASEKGTISEGLHQVLIDVFGPESLAEAKPLYDAGGDEAFPAECRARSTEARELSRSVRMEMLKELGKIALMDEKITPSEGLSVIATGVRSALIESATLLGLTEDDLSVALAEYVQPPFSKHLFSPGDGVDVYLDGEWMAGTVEEILFGRELRIRFAESGQCLKLQATADLIRPRRLGRAG